MNEAELREKAQRHAGEIVEGSGTRGKPKRMTHMVSVSLSGELIRTLRAIAKERGITLSALMGEAAKEKARRSVEEA